MKKLLFTFPIIALLAIGCNKAITTDQNRTNTTANTPTPTPQATSDVCKKITRETGTFALKENATVSIQEQINKGGYTFADLSIKSQNFKLNFSGTHTVAIYDLTGALTSDQIINCMKNEAYTPASIDDTLALGAQYPNEQKKSPIIFLGTFWSNPNDSGHQNVPGLSMRGYAGGRQLSLYYYDTAWQTPYRFAAIHQ